MPIKKGAMWQLCTALHLGTAEPEPNVLGPVLHEERHTVAVPEAGADEEVGHPVAEFVQSPEGPRLLLEVKTDPVGVPPHGPVEDAGHRQVELLVQPDRGQQAQIAVGAPGDRSPG